jgi:hypothetical protein
MNAKFTRSEQSNLYHSYLVRFWRDTPDVPWRASAQCVQTGNTLLFGNVESLLAFLQAEFKTDTPAGETAQTAFTNHQL